MPRGSFVPSAFAQWDFHWAGLQTFMCFCFILDFFPFQGFLHAVSKMYRLPSVHVDKGISCRKCHVCQFRQLLGCRPVQIFAWLSPKRWCQPNHAYSLLMTHHGLTIASCSVLHTRYKTSLLSYLFKYWVQAHNCLLNSSWVLSLDFLLLLVCSSCCCSDWVKILL